MHLLHALATALLVATTSLASPSGPALQASASAADPSWLSRGLIDAKIAELEGRQGDLSQSDTELLDIYRKTVTALEQIEAYRASAQRYREQKKSAPEDAERLRQAAEDVSAPPPPSELASLQQIEQALEKLQADETAVETKRATIERDLTNAANRSSEIRTTLIELRQRATADPVPVAGESPKSQAQYWLAEAQRRVAQAQIEALDEELLSQPARVNRLEAERDYLNASLEWMSERERELEFRIAQMRMTDAEKAVTDAVALANSEIADGNPLFRALAASNARLAREIVEQARWIETLAEREKDVDDRQRAIEQSFELTRRELRFATESNVIGRVLERRRNNLPSLTELNTEQEQLREEAAKLGLDRLERQREAEAWESSKQALTDLAGDEFAALVEARRELLASARSNDVAISRGLGELSIALGQLEDTTTRYSAFLDEHLLWVRSSSGTSIAALRELPSEVRGIQRIITGAARRFLSPWPRFIAALVLLVISGALLAVRQAALRLLEALAERVEAHREIFWTSLGAFALTVFIAAEVPLALLWLAWQLDDPTEPAATETLKRLAEFVFWMRVSRLLVRPRGLAEVHFGWPEPVRSAIRRSVLGLSIIGIPATTIGTLAVLSDPPNFGGMLAMLSFMAITLSLAVALFQVSRPNSGVIKGLFHQANDNLARIISPLLVAIPLGLTVASFEGYLYATAAIGRNLIDSLWFITSLVVAHELALRWLRAAHHRLRMSKDRPEAGERNLEEVSSDARTSLHAVFLILGVITMATVWSELLPVLNGLDRYTLWTVPVPDGETTTNQSVTIASAIRALLVLAGTIAITRVLPPLLDIGLQRSMGMTHSMRYTIAALANYGFWFIGLGWIFSALGFGWSRLQWLVAALGVGIGFGLQEIVANFISGLIIFFEQPIRVGDVVTLGNVDGTVTKINIRATTIRDWEQKELLVPNKEFITNRLLNWSLSDSVTRLEFRVSVTHETDIDEALAALLRIANNHPRVLAKPEAYTVLEDINEHALLLILRAYVGEIDHRIATQDSIRQSIVREFRERGITVARPRHDVRLEGERPPPSVTVDAAPATPGEASAPRRSSAVAEPAPNDDEQPRDEHKRKHDPRDGPARDRRAE